MLVYSNQLPCKFERMLQRVSVVILINLNPFYSFNLYVNKYVCLYFYLLKLVCRLIVSLPSYKNQLLALFHGISTITHTNVLIVYFFKLLSMFNDPYVYRKSFFSRNYVARIVYFPRHRATILYL